MTSMHLISWPIIDYGRYRQLLVMTGDAAAVASSNVNGVQLAYELNYLYRFQG